MTVEMLELTMLLLACKPVFNNCGQPGSPAQDFGTKPAGRICPAQLESLPQQEAGVHQHCQRLSLGSLCHCRAPATVLIAV